MLDNVYVLNRNKQVVATLSIEGSNPFFDYSYHEYLETGASTFDFSIILDRELEEALLEKNFVLFKRNDKLKMFQIMTCEDEEVYDGIQRRIYSETVGLELANSYVRATTIEGNMNKFLSTILQDTNYYVGYVSSTLDNLIVTTEITEPTSVYTLIQNAIADYDNCEIEFDTRCISSIEGQYQLLINVYGNGEKGNRKYKRFDYNFNSYGMTRTGDASQFCSGLIGVGQNSVDFKDIEWKVSKGDPLDKPLGQDFLLDPQAHAMFSNGAKYILGKYSSSATTPEDLINDTYKKLQELKQVKYDYEVPVYLTEIEYEDVEIGDTNYIVNDKFNPPLQLEARVSELEITDKTSKLIFSNYKEVKSKIFSVKNDLDILAVREIVDAYFPITSSGISDGAITEGKIETTYIQQITSDIVSAGKVVTEELIAKEVTAIEGQFEELETKYATIENLNSTNANIDKLQVDKANITDLNVTNANVTNLTAQVGSINTLVNGNLTSDNIHSLHLTSANTTVDNAFIKDAMIDSVTANKIVSGTINTSNVNIQSSDGSMILTGSVQQFKDENGKVRIQIGKDASGNFTFVLYDENGTGVLLDESGIKSSEAISDGLIRNDHISDNAHIDGSKLDIASVITEVNNDNSTTIKSNKILLNEQGQSLEVAFNSLKSQVETIQDVTIDGDLSSIMEQVQSNTTEINVTKEGINTLVAQNTVITETVKDLDGDIKQVNTTMNTKFSSIDQNINGITSSVKDVTSKYDNMTIGGRNLALATNQGAENWTWSLGVGGVTKEDYEEDGINGVKFVRDSVDATSWSVIMYQNLNLKAFKPSTEYVVSMDINVPVDTKCNVAIRRGDGSQSLTNTVDFTPVPTVGEWTRVSAVIKTYDTLPEINGQIVYINNLPNSTGKTYMIRNLKVEEGNKATSYTPAPEDVAQGIADAQDLAGQSKDIADGVAERVTVNESTIQQLADSISMLVTDENGTSMMTQTGEGWTFNLGGINSTLESTANQLNTLSGDVDTANEVIDGLNKTVEGLATKTSYITMGTAENGEPCIELGQATSDFKVQITNTAMNFLQGTTRIAWINNESLYIEKAVIEDELQIGNGTSGSWVWATRTNGNLGLRWK